MTERRTSRINIRVTPAERREIELCAHDACLGVSDYLRKCALEAGDRPVIRVDSELLRKNYILLKRSANLLNQCARELNTHHHPSQIEDDLAAAFCAVAESSNCLAEFIAEARNSV